MLLKAESLVKSYGTGHNQRIVLDSASIQVMEGESIAILGPSGSGKTTLLNILGSLDRPDSGSVFFRDEDITSFRDHRLDIFRNRNAGFVFQSHHLLPQLTLYENVILPAMVIKDKHERDEKHAYAATLMKRVGLWDRRLQLPSQLSGGECQRTAVIRAIVNSPSVVFADEPTGALDSRNAENIADLLAELNTTEKIALVVVTHSSHLAGKMRSVYELNDGKLVKNER